MSLKIYLSYEEGRGGGGGGLVMKLCLILATLWTVAR